MRFRIAVLFLLAVAARAARADDRPLVIFFGGVGFGQSAADSWRAAFTKKNPGYDFVTIPFYGSLGLNVPYETVVSDGHAQIQRALGLIEKNKGRNIIIVGHSYGSALADRVTALAAQRGLISPEKDNEIILEGLRPRSGFPARDCWTTENSNAPNWNEMNTGCPAGRNHKMPSKSGGKWSLHYSVVTNDGGNYGSHDVNLAWLPKASGNSSVRTSTGSSGGSVGIFLVPGTPGSPSAR
jgi:hypothetical protein